MSYAATSRDAHEQKYLEGILPNTTQLLVLKAALLDHEGALPAYQEWLRTFRLEDEFSREIFRLVPLLYDNLRRLGHEDHLTGRLKGVYRMSWAKSQRMFHQTRPLLERFQAAGLRMMVLKGAPLALNYYQNVAARPMADVDVVVPVDRIHEADSIMKSLGFEASLPLDQHVLRFRHAVQYLAAPDREFDLHWHMLFDLNSTAVDEVFWKTSQPFDFLDMRFEAPDATRLLFHTLMHGMRWNSEPPIRWIPDSLMIVRRKAAEIDWQWIVDFSRVNHITYRLRVALAFLQQHFTDAIPAEVVPALAAAPLSWRERLEKRAVLREVRFETLSGPMLSALCEYPRTDPSSNFLSTAVEFTHFLRMHWKLRGRRDIPKMILRGLWRQATMKRHA